MRRSLAVTILQISSCLAGGKIFDEHDALMAELPIGRAAEPPFPLDFQIFGCKTSNECCNVVYANVIELEIERRAHVARQAEEHLPAFPRGLTPLVSLMKKKPTVITSLNAYMKEWESFWKDDVYHTYSAMAYFDCWDERTTGLVRNAPMHDHVKGRWWFQRPEGQTIELYDIPDPTDWLNGRPRDRYDLPARLTQRARCIPISSELKYRMKLKSKMKSKTTCVDAEGESSSAAEQRQQIRRQSQGIGSKLLRFMLTTFRPTCGGDTSNTCKAPDDTFEIVRKPRPE